MAERRDAPFNLNSRVRLRGSSRTGIVTAVLPGRQYRILFGPDEEPIVAEGDLEFVGTEPRFVSAREFLRELLLFKLRRPLSDTLYSYAASRTNFEAYQFKPAVKFVSHPTNSILIADEVGLGKTIEACIIYLELKARMRGDLRRVLVVCPAGLTEKWRVEFQARFAEDFTILDGQGLQRLFREWGRLGPRTELRGICSLERLRREEVARIIPELGMQFDIVIVDEAHHMRNPETLSFDLGEVLSNHADGLVLLTATPVHLRSLDLFYLLHILEPGEFESPELFQYRLEPNRYINRAIISLSRIPPDVEGALSWLKEAPEHIRENPYYVEAVTTLQAFKDTLSREDARTRRVEVIRGLHRLNTFSYIFNRTRRKDVTPGTTRLANVVSVELLPLESEIYDEALEFARAKAQAVKGYAHVLGLIQIERQLASSIGGFKTIVDDFLRGITVPIETEESSSELEYPTVILAGEAYELARSLASLYRELGDRDSKFERFRDELSRLLQEHSKVIVFSFFRRTLGYLARRLSNLGYTVEVIHGGKGVMERQRILDRFRDDENCRILLSSEVGSEGLDFQFCDTIVNYDLPWNPMKVEQRIGRADRYGQKSEKVTVVSFFLQGTIEERILQRLYTRIGIFEESIGQLEPILGDIVKELSFEAITKRLTPDEEVRKTEEYLSTLENRKRELEEFENHRYELMGQDQLFAQEVDTNIASGRYVSPSEIKALCFSYIEEAFPRCHFQPVEDKTDIWYFVPHEEFEDGLRQFLRRERSGEVNWEFLRKTERCFKQGGPRGVPVTFDSEVAHQRRLLQFINIWHPLARMAFEYYTARGGVPPEQRLVRFIAATDDRNIVGDYHFFLFSMSVRAIVNSAELVPVLVDVRGDISEAASSGLLRTLHNLGAEERENSNMRLSVARFEQAMGKALEHMGKVRGEREHLARQRNDALIAMRRSALERTFQAKIRRAQERLSKAQDPRIIRMHQGEIRNLQDRLDKSLDELETRQQVTVTYEPVAYGLVRLAAGQDT